VKLAFIAEAPSYEEMVVNEPLVGPSGRLFWRLLRMTGLARTDDPPEGFRPDMKRHGLRPLLWARKDHFVGNVWDTQLPDNDMQKLFAGAVEAERDGFKDADSYAPNYGWLRPDNMAGLRRLQLELETYDPDIIIPLGAGSLWAFTGSTGITEARGIVQFASRIMPGRKIVPTLHPAHVLQDYRFLGVVAADIMRGVREAVSPTTILHHLHRELWIEPTLGDLDLWWDQHGRSSTLLSVDIETVRGQVTCVGFASDAGHAICCPLVDYRASNRSYWRTVSEEMDAWCWIEKVLASATPKVFQNGLYDCAYLWGRMGLRVMNYRHDTRLMHHVLQPELPKSLAFLGSTYGKPPLPWKLLRSNNEEKREA
jgi:uracil-DNA glycosylase